MTESQATEQTNSVPSESVSTEPLPVEPASEDPQPIGEALAMIDRGLGTVQDRELVSASEVSDLLLDLRLLLMAADDTEAPVTDPSPA